MSYDIRLTTAPGGDSYYFPPEVPVFVKGGTYSMYDDPSPVEAWLNITFNYSNQFAKVFPIPTQVARDCGSILCLQDMRVSDAIPLVEKAEKNLGDDVNPDYWKSTEGNAKQALHKLLIMMKVANALSSDPLYVDISY